MDLHVSLFLRIVPIGKVTKIDDMTHIGWCQERISASFEKEKIVISFFTFQDHHLAWDIPSDQVEKALFLVESLIKTLPYEALDT